MKDAAKASGATLCYDMEATDEGLPQGRTIRSIRALRPALEADKIINLPKLKTHMMMTFSGAVKNLFGIVPGSLKAEYHFRFEDEGDFAGVLVDICQFANPTLTVMDTVVGMEGSGPANGTPRSVGLILSGADPYDLDVVASAAVGLDPKTVPTVRECMKRGLCSGRVADVATAGKRLEDVAVRDFKMPENKVAFNIWDWVLPPFLARRLNRAQKYKPGFCTGKCRGCGVCEKSCPARAIKLKSGKPAVDLRRCISCFCCHELCNYDAVRICKPWVFKVFFK